jgi:mannose-6-phosphate isomerase-like protein (cupin superfamily)
MDDSIYTVALGGRKSLLKPPFSVRLRSGSVVLAPGEEVGEHKTEGREEAIIVLSGTATIVCEGLEATVSAKMLAYIPPESVHNVFNRGTEPLEYVYLVTPISDATSGEHSHGGMKHVH